MSIKEDEAAGSKKTKRRKRLDGFEEWGGYMAAKKSKLETQFEEKEPIELQNQTGSTIFKGIAIFVTGYTDPPAEELKRLMLVHGGKYHYYYSHSKTTHIIASNLQNCKIRRLKKEIVVTVQWITDSISAGKLLPSHKYLLYSPEIKDKQQTLHFDKVSPSKTEPSSIIESNPNLVLDSEILSNGILGLELNNDIVNEFENLWPQYRNPETFPENINGSYNGINSELSHINEPSHSATNSEVTIPHKQKPAIQAGHPEFLTEFYGHSRLHHISTAGQELKRYVQHLAESITEFPGKEKLKSLSKKHDFTPISETGAQKSWNMETNYSDPVVMHIDMDCFFVSVGLRNRPELQGYPVAVTHSKGKRGGPQEGSDIHYEASYYENKSEKKVKGLIDIEEDEDFREPKPKLSINSKEYGSLSEIASCNYEARKAGLYNGMFLGEALRRCPNLKTIPYDFQSYNEVSKQLYDIVSSYTLEIEAVSVDELFIDCTELLNGTETSPYQFASTIRKEIFEKTKCPASAGLGPNMLLARLSTKVAKPNGQYHISGEEIEDFMKKQKVGDLPGVGYRITKKLHILGIKTCAELQNLSMSKLQQEFGQKLGESLYKKSRGKDSRTVQLHKDRKSVSAEINYGIRFETKEDVTHFINQMAVEVQGRLQHINCKGKTITLKLMVRRPDAPIETAKFMGHGVCDNLSKSIVLKSATDSSKTIGNECCTLAQSLKIKPQDYRGVGIQVGKLEPIERVETYRKTLKNFFNNVDNNASKPATVTQNESVSPKTPKAKTVTKSPPRKSTIKHFLSKPSRKLTYDLADYVPEQLDQSVLNALPEDLRKEILENCGKPSTSHVTLRPRKATTTKSPPTPPVSSAKFVQKKLSRKLSSSERTKPLPLNSEPVPSVLPPSNGIVSKTEPLSNKIYNKKQVLKKECSASKSISADSHKKRVIEIYITWGKTEKKPPSNPDKKTSLGGAVELDDVRKLLKEWIVNTQTPLEEDIEELKEFLLDSIDQDISKVSLLLKYFYRLASSHGLVWKEAYLSILSYVQQKMLQNFGAMLSASSDFPT